MICTPKVRKKLLGCTSQIGVDFCSITVLFIAKCIREYFKFHLKCFILLYNIIGIPKKINNFTADFLNALNR